MTVPLITQLDLTDRIDLVGNLPLALPRYDEVCRAVRQALTVDEVDEFIARAEAVRAYAKQARNRQLEIDAAEIRIRAERRVGELMAGAGRTIGLVKPQQSASGFRKNPLAPPTLAEAGIDKGGDLIAPAATGLAAENAVMRRRVASLLRENPALECRVKTWKERAEQAGWKEPADASPPSG